MGLTPRSAWAVVAAAAGLSACTSPSSSATLPPTNTPSTTATVSAHSPSPTPSAEPKTYGEQAKAAMPTYYGTVDRVFQSGGKLKSQLADVAVAGQLSLLQQQADLLLQRKDHQEGNVRLISTTVLAVVAQKGRLPSVTLRTCIDTSRRRLVDENGKDLTAPGTKTFSTRYTMILRNGSWLAASSDLVQKDPSCA